MPQEKIKVLKESVRNPFKEVKAEKVAEESEEENLEDVFEPEESVNFAEFSRRTSPVLEKTNEAEPLEQTLQNIPTTTKEEETIQAKYESNVYNMPEYSYEKEALPTRKEMTSRNLIISHEDIGEVRPRERFEEWHEIRTARERSVEEPVLGVEAFDRKEKMPWEERKYKGKKL